MTPQKTISRMIAAKRAELKQFKAEIKDGRYHISPVFCGYVTPYWEVDFDRQSLGFHKGVEAAIQAAKQHKTARS